MIACITVRSAGSVAMATVLAGVHSAHDTMMVQELYSKTRADRMRFWARRWLVLDDIGQGSISCFLGASGLRPGHLNVGPTNITRAEMRQGYGVQIFATPSKARPLPNQIFARAKLRGTLPAATAVPRRGYAAPRSALY